MIIPNVSIPSIEPISFHCHERRNIERLPHFDISQSVDEPSHHQNLPSNSNIDEESKIEEGNVSYKLAKIPVHNARHCPVCSNPLPNTFDEV